jgi:multidrug resistance efflux pump
MTFQAIELRLPQPGKSLPYPRKTIRQAALNLLLASATIAAATYIAHFLIGENQPVKASQVAAHIDRLELSGALDEWTALDRTRTQLETAEASIHKLDAQIVLERSVIARQKAHRAETQAFTSAQLAAAENMTEVLAAERVKAEAQRDRSRAKLHQAALNLSYTRSEIAELDADVMRDSAAVKER